MLSKPNIAIEWRTTRDNSKVAHRTSSNSKVSVLFPNAVSLNGEVSLISSVNKAVMMSISGGYPGEA